MSFHILHLLSPNLRIRVKLDQLHIEDSESGQTRSVPLEDIAIIISAAPDFIITAGALRRMAEMNVLLMICNQKFEPVSLTLPHFCPTSTEVLRRQVEWTPAWKQALWQQVVTAKIRNQAEVLKEIPRSYELLKSIADNCLIPPRSSPSSGQNTAQVTASKRDLVRQWHPAACESRAARLYWRKLLPQISPDAVRREPGTRAGVNGMLDYGYAVLRTAVLRSLVAHGFIAALGIHHKAKAGSFALADDLMEPLRPFIDSRLRKHLKNGGTLDDMKKWAPHAAGILIEEVPMPKGKMRLLNAIDDYIQSFQQTSNSGVSKPLQFPMLSVS
jgi:CRISPR-associated protein Cas1